MTTATVTDETQQNPTPKKRRRARWERAFIAALEETGNVTAACKLAEIDRTVVYDARNAHPDLAQEWDNALDVAADNLETEARRRAVQGVAEPVYQGGRLVGTIQKYSDTLLIFLLKGARPETYRERHDHTARLETPLSITSIVAVKPDDAP